MLQKEIETCLQTYRDSYLETDYISAKAVQSLVITADKVVIEIVLGYPCLNVAQNIHKSLTDLIQPLLKTQTLTVNVQSRIEAHANKQNLPSLHQVKNVIAVASGKGGVGKSTVALQLALALKEAGATVGLLDADIYGPSQPTFLGTVQQRPEIVDKKLQPILSHGLQTMSIGYLVDDHVPLAWRGPMLGKALQQLTHDTNWQGLDYLIIDLPPGTGDVQLTMCQKIPVTGAIIVTTPQDVALVDVRRACEMFQKMNVNMLGVVENMSFYHCTACGHAAHLFGEGGGDKLSAEYGLSLFAKIPLNPHVVNHEAEKVHDALFSELANKVSAKLALLPKDYSAKFPKVVVE